MIPLCIPYIDEQELNAVKEVLDSGWLAHGPKTKEFEANFAKYIGVKKAIAVNSCTSALQLAIMALGLKGEVIIPSFTFMATANAVVNAGCTPVFCDIDYNTCNINPDEIRKLVTKDTAAVIPVHIYGQACKMDEIMEIANKHSLAVIEDSAQTIGGTFGGKKTGSFGIGCFSFYPTKNMTTGEGGMITTNDEELAVKMEVLKAHGTRSSAYEREKQERPWIRVAENAGFNFRMCDINSAIGIVQLQKLDKMNEMRRKNSQYLTKNLSSVPWLDVPFESRNCTHVYQTYTIRTKNANRNKVAAHLKSQGIGASVHYDPPVHLQSFYLNSKRGDMAVTERVANSIISLPMYPHISQGDLDHMIKIISSIAV